MSRASATGSSPAVSTVRIAARRVGNCSRFVLSGRLPGVASKKRSNVMTQRAQNGVPTGSDRPEVESRLEQILESIEADAPPLADDADVDTDAEPGYFPPSMRLPSQGHSMTRLGQAMVDRGLITHDELDRALEHQRVTRKRLGESLIDI